MIRRMGCRRKTIVATQKGRVRHGVPPEAPPTSAIAVPIAPYRESVATAPRRAKAAVELVGSQKPTLLYAAKMFFCELESCELAPQIFVGPRPYN